MSRVRVSMEQHRQGKNRSLTMLEQGDDWDMRPDRAKNCLCVTHIYSVEYFWYITYKSGKLRQKGMWSSGQVHQSLIVDRKLTGKLV